MTDYTKYDDLGLDEVFPHGKLYRISYVSSSRRMRVVCASQSDFDHLYNTFSDKNKSSFFIKQYGYSVPDRIYMINQFGYFPSGLLFNILKAIKLRYGSLSVVAMSQECKNYVNDFLTPLKKILNGKRFEISNVSEDSVRNSDLIKQGNKPFLFRDYQKKAIENLLFKGYGRGMISLPTSAGKTLVVANYFYNIRKHINSDYNILLLVPNKQLVFQAYNDFKDYGLDMSDVTMFTAGLKKSETYNPKAKIIIANRQYVFANKKLLPRIDVLFVDEIHTSQAESTAEFINTLDCRLKSGCSGSIPKDKIGRWRLIGMFGDVVHTEEITDLQKRGFISNLKLIRINITDMNVQNNRNYLFHLQPLRRYSPDENGYSEIPFNAAHDAEHEYYEQNYKDLYKPVLEEIRKYDENTLFLFDRIEFGKRLFDLAGEIFKESKIHYIDGSVPVKDRLEITRQFENSGNNVLFAEFATFSVGVSIKRLTNLVFISSSKSFPRILQSIGRTLRLHDSKEEARIFDISMNFKYSQKHLRERLEIYRTEYNKIPDETINITIDEQKENG